MILIQDISSSLSDLVNCLKIEVFYWITILPLSSQLSRSTAELTNSHASSEDSDQPMHPRCLIRGLTDRMMKQWVSWLLKECQGQTLIRLCCCVG